MHDPSELYSSMNTLLYQPSASDHNMNIDQDSDEDISCSHAMAAAAGMPLEPISFTFDDLAAPGAEASRASSTSLSETSTSSSESNEIRDLDDVSLDAPSREKLMLRFHRETCGILSVKDGPTENPWRTLIWPLARESSALYHAISSMTAFHGAHENPMLHTRGMAHMTKSIKRLASEIGNMRLEFALATSLALAFSEGWDNHVSTGTQHLRAAKFMVNTVITKYQRDKQSGQMTIQDENILRFLCNTFVYMDVIARLTSFEETVNPLDLEEILAMVNGPLGDQVEIDPLMGCATSLFPLIGRVATLIQRVRTTASNSLTIVSTAMELKEQLQKWQIPSVVMFERPEDPNSEVQHSIQTAEAYRYATLLYLHQAVPEIPSHPAQTLAKKVLITLASVPLSSGATIVQIFPLFVASCEVTDSEDRSWVTQRWMAMMTRIKIGNVKACWSVVQEVWRRRDASENEKANYLLRRYESRCVRESGFAPRYIAQGLKKKVHAVEPTDGNGSLNQGQSHAQSLPHDKGNISHAFWPKYPVTKERANSGGQPLLSRVAKDSTCGRVPMSMPTGVTEAHESFKLSVNPGHNYSRHSMVDITSPGQLEEEYTVRGKLHWLGVMTDWQWEGMFLLDAIPCLSASVLVYSTFRFPPILHLSTALRCACVCSPAIVTYGSLGNFFRFYLSPGKMLYHRSSSFCVRKSSDCSQRTVFL